MSADVGSDANPYPYKLCFVSNIIILLFPSEQETQGPCNVDNGQTRVHK